MTINERLREALGPLALPCKPDVYMGQEEEYLTFNYDSSPIFWGDNRPAMEQLFVQVHYICPLRADRLTVRERIKGLIWAAFDEWPDEIDATDEDGQHWVYEFTATQVIAAE